MYHDAPSGDATVHEEARPRGRVYIVQATSRGGWTVVTRARMGSTVYMLVLGGLVTLSAETTAQGFRSESIRGRFLFDFGPTYNRVEGLPISIGAIIETIQDNPFRVQGRAIIRVEDDIPLDLDRAGFQVQAEKFFGSNRRYSVGAAGWSQLVWIEDRGISNLETSLATFFFHDDRRDYYDGIGVAAFGRYAPTNSPLQIVLQYEFEEQAPMNTSGASSIFRNGDLWRLQPLAASGRLHSIIGTVVYDTRPRRPDGPFNGWYARARVQQAVTGSLVNLSSRDESGALVTDLPDPDNNLTTSLIDIRRYNAIADVGINLRLLAGGSLTNKPLPPQLQHAIGGVGSLPGYHLFELDCGARTANANIVPERATLAVGFYRFYGCDRFILAQIQVTGYLGFKIAAGQDRSVWEGPASFTLNLVPQWAVFANAGRGWSSMDPQVTTALDEDMAYDVGGGLFFGDIGFYGAYPLTGAEKSVKGVVRLQSRF